jgi:ribosome-binding factor A
MARRQDGGVGRTQRQLRVGEELRHALAEVLRGAHFRDPELQDVNVTVTEVQISPDLKHATAFAMTLGGTDLTPKLAALNRAAPYLRGEMARAVQLRHAPSLHFEIDGSFNYAAKIEGLLHSQHVVQDLVEEAPEEDADADADDEDAADEDTDDDKKDDKQA